METREPERLILMLPDGQSATFTPAGQLLDKTNDADEHLRYLIETDEGRWILKPSDFQQRVKRREG